MSGIGMITERIVDRLNVECACVSNIKLPYGGSYWTKLSLPVVMIHPSAVMVFVQIDARSDASDKGLVIGFRRALNALIEKLDISMNSFLIYGFRGANDEMGIPSELYAYNIYNDRIRRFLFEEESESFVDFVVDELSCRRPVFDEAEVSLAVTNLEFITGSNGEVKKDAEGNYLIKKHGQWYIASDMDPDAMFQYTSLFGCFGAHKFSERKRLMGLVYFFTCGLFGVGWFFDCLSILFGTYRDSEGKYLLPVSNRKACLLKMLGGVAITVVYFLLYRFLLLNLTHAINSLLDKAVSSGGAMLGKGVE